MKKPISIQCLFTRAQTLYNDNTRSEYMEIIWRYHTSKMDNFSVTRIRKMYDVTNGTSTISFIKLDEIANRIRKKDFRKYKFYVICLWRVDSLKIDRRQVCGVVSKIKVNTRRSTYTHLKSLKLKIICSIRIVLMYSIHEY